jgi:3-oxoacyl-[acyl-carrier protein] reductase
MRLSQKVAIITGAGQGIGKASALAFAGQGARLVLNARTRADIEAVAGQIEGMRGSAVAVAGDISDQLVVKQVVDAAIASFGKIDILVNNAGSGRSASGGYKPYEQIEEKDWYYIMEQNVKSSHLCCLFVIPHMKQQNSGSIINISSVAGRTCEPGQSSRKLLAPIEATYVSAKAALHGLTKQLARDLGAYGIRVNAIAPGVILSSERLESYWKSKSESERRKVTDLIPLMRPGRPEEIANAVLFLASDEASYVTGATLDVNGGIFMSP